EALAFKPDEDPVDIKWRTLPKGQFFDIDRERRNLRLNARYRTELLGHHSLEPNDAPVLKTLLHLLAAELFEGPNHGPRAKSKEEARQSLLDAAPQEKVKPYRARNQTGDECRHTLPDARNTRRILPRRHDDDATVELVAAVAVTD